MNLKRNLGQILLASTIGFGLVGCSNPDYHFYGKIADDKVRFYQSGTFGEENYIEVTKPNEIIVTYMDISGSDFKLDAVKITTNNETKMYWRGVEDGDKIVKKFQKQFDDYLKKILEVKKQEGLKNLR